MNTFELKFRDHTLHLGANTCIMGILNVTPDSFSDGGVFFKHDKAVAHAQKMVEEGADIIDIGGESTRPFSEPVSLDEELRRVVPVIESLTKHIRVPISVDTTKAEVARQSILAGASIVNDITAMEGDPEMAAVVSEYKVPVVVMHMKGTPKTMQVRPEYEDPIEEIYAYLSGIIQKAGTYNIPKSRIIVDPGIGFGKTVHHNLLIHKALGRFKKLGVPLLFGSSRKSFIRSILSEGVSGECSSEWIETGSQASVAAAVLNGADIVRVHDVKQTAATVKIIDEIKHA